MPELLRLENIVKTFHPGQTLGEELAGLWRRMRGGSERQVRGGVQAVRGLSLAVRRGEVLGLVGESGSGKSTLGRVMAGLYRPEAGRVFFDGRDVFNLDGPGRLHFRRRAQIMFQDPASSLNPRFTAGAALAEGLAIHRLAGRRESRKKTLELLAEVGLPPEPERYPHQFSGGQRQRLSLARALSLDPELLIADEPVSALDVSIQAQIVNLLLDLKERRGLTLVMISHDLPLVRFCADRVAVMYGGLLMEVVEGGLLGLVEHHPYVRSLWAAAGGENRDFILAGEPPDPRRPPAGCPFHPRCPETAAICRRQRPTLAELAPGWTAACHRRTKKGN